MHVVISGGAGFIGSHVVEAALALGYEVTVVDNFSTGRRDNLPHETSFRLFEGDIRNLDLCRRALRKAECVIHLAALPSVPRSLVDPIATHEVCATGTLNMLMAARDSGVRRFVYAASSSAYGDTAELPKHELMTPSPRSPYAVAKLTGEYYCSAFHAAFGLETVALRYFNVFGPRQSTANQYGAVIPKFIDAALRKESPTIFGTGNQTRDFTYVANAVSANMLACRASKKAIGRVYNVGCGTRITINELWSRIEQLTGSDVQARYEGARLGDVRDSMASLELAEAYLGYHPEVSLGEGLERTIEFFQATRS